MSLLDERELEKYGISSTLSIVYKPDYELLYAEETKGDLSGPEAAPS